MILERRDGLGGLPLLPLGVLAAFFPFDQIDTTAAGALVP